MNTTPNITVSALTAGWDIASSRFRVRQYIPHLEQQGIIVREHVPWFGESCGLPSPFKIAARIPALFTTRRADVIWISRELVQGYETFERLLKRPRIMDVDDAIWRRWPLGRWRMPHIARGMDAVIAGNAYLAEWFGQFCRQVHIIPTGIDLERYPLRHESQGELERFVIGWTGQACNFKYLEIIEAPLRRFLADHPDSEILIMAQRPWQSEHLPKEKVKFVRWDRDTETSALHHMSVGIMPLTDDDWTRGKCSFKMLQYMAVGLPVVVSPVGMNREVLRKGTVGLTAASEPQWYEALDALYRDWNLRNQMGRAGRKVVEQHYNTKTLAQELARIFHQAAC